METCVGERRKARDPSLQPAVELPCDDPRPRLRSVPMLREPHNRLLHLLAIALVMAALVPHGFAVLCIGQDGHMEVEAAHPVADCGPNIGVSTEQPLLLPLEDDGTCFDAPLSSLVGLIHRVPQDQVADLSFLASPGILVEVLDIDEGLRSPRPFPEEQHARFSQQPLHLRSTVLLI